ncbi:MAG: polysaccharide deacetylase family protein, partial [Vulcanimicrobiaceae bacterium]
MSHRRLPRLLLRTVVGVVILALAIVGGYELFEQPTSQIWGRTFVHGPPNQKVVALTYDDGPNPPYTDRILDVLER